MFQPHLQAIGGVGVDHDAILFPGHADRRQAIGVAAGTGHKAEFGDLGLQAGRVQIESLAGIHRTPQFGDALTVAADQIEDEAFEVGGLGDIHRRAGGMQRLRRSARAIDAGAEKFVEHIVFVGGDDQFADRQAHHARDVAGADIAEVAGRHRKIDLLPAIAGYREVGLEVIDDLRRDARPVDRIHRADAVFRLEGMIVGHRLDDVLALVEHTAHRDVEDIAILQRIHLRLLEASHAVFRRQHEHAHIVLAAHRVFRRRTGIAGSCAKDVDVLPGLIERVLEQIAEQLHGHVLERQRRTVGQFQDVEAVVFFTLQLAYRRDLAEIRIGAAVAVSLGGIGFIHQCLQIIRLDVVGQAGQDGKGQLPVIHAAHEFEFGGGKLWIGFRQIQAAVGREAAKEDLQERLLGRLAASGEITHGQVGLLSD